MTEAEKENDRIYAKVMMQKYRDQRKTIKKFGSKNTLAEVMEEAQTATDEELTIIEKKFKGNPDFFEAIKAEIDLRTFLRREKPYFYLPIRGG